MKVKINGAEMVAEVFWNPELSQLEKWTFLSAYGSNAIVSQEWDCVKFEWQQMQLGSPVFSFSRNCELECGEYDYLLIFMAMPEKSEVTIRLQTDIGEKYVRFDPFLNPVRELQMSIKDISVIFRIEIEAIPAQLGYGVGNIKWIGLQNEGRLKNELQKYAGYDGTWEGYLKPESYEPSFKPSYGLILTMEELEELRNAAMEQSWGMEDGKLIEELLSYIPEHMIGGYLNFWEDTRFARERDWHKRLTRKGLLLANLGILKQDKRLLRMAARYAMSMGMCDTWYDSFLCDFREGCWEHRGFTHSIAAYEICTILDLAGEYFTERGRNLLLRKLAEKAIGNINFITWKHDYIFYNNQLIWFSHGRMLAYAVLEQHYQHVAPYTEIAYQDICENLNQIVLEDGGYGEGPSYFNCIGQHAMLALYFYARLRKRKLHDVVPERVKKCTNFFECIMSTDDGQDVLPVCDGKSFVEQETLGFMNYLVPDSVYMRMLIKKTKGIRKFSGSILMDYFRIASDTMYSPLRNFILMPKLGMASSVRFYEGKLVKIFLMGNVADADHAHEDKGSFILEYAGETYAMDSGTCDYSNPMSGILQFCQRHNMLVPYGMDQRPHPERPNHKDVKASGTGDDVSLFLEVDLGCDWNGIYRKWVRRLFSPTPEHLRIVDEYELDQGIGVVFFWNTMLPVEVEGKRILLNGKNGQLEIIFPQDCSVSVIPQQYLHGMVQNSIQIQRPEKSGKLEIDVYIRS